MYTVPGKHFFRLHHVRPRFKRQVEDVLVFMASEIVRLGMLPKSDFDSELDKAIRFFPGNANLSPKTVANWRTEISALFGLVQKSGGNLGPTKLAKRLADSGDLISFFRTYLAKFQYPGGHVKPQYVADCINHDVKFKPAAYVVRVLLAGQALSTTGKFWVEKNEAAALIWNDLRVTQGSAKPKEIAQRILDLRIQGTTFDNDGDVVRYAGDILDYMVLANILSFHPSGRYFLVPGTQEAANLILSNDGFFSGYDSIYSAVYLEANHLTPLEEDWFDYAGNQIDNLVMDTDPLSVLQAYAADSNSDQGEPQMGGEDSQNGNVAIELLDFLREKLTGGQAIAKKEIGNVGEYLVLRHEHNRLVESGAKNQADKVRKIPDHLGIGYDIKSFLDGTEAQKLIEVKTTISHGQLKVSQFHLTKSEWKAAEASGESYYVYRIRISNHSISCFVIHNPIEKYKESLLSMTISEGADIVYKKEAGYWETLMVP